MKLYTLYKTDTGEIVKCGQCSEATVESIAKQATGDVGVLWGSSIADNLLENIAGKTVSDAPVFESDLAQIKETDWQDVKDRLVALENG